MNDLDNKNTADELMDFEQENESGFNLDDIVELFFVIRRNWLIMLISLIVIIMLGAVYTIRQVKLYEASSSIVLKMDKMRPLGRSVEGLNDQSYYNYWAKNSFLQTQIKIIPSTKVLGRVVNELNLKNDLEFLGLSELPKEKLPEVLKNVNPVSILAGRTTVSNTEDTELVTISVRDPNPERAALLVNTIINSYISYTRESKTEMASFAVDWLKDQSNTLREQLRTAEKKMYDFQQDKGIVATDFEARKKIISDQISQLTANYNNIKSEYWQLSAELKTINGIKKKPERILVEEIFENTWLSDKLAPELFQLEQSMYAISTVYGEKHPKYIEVKSQLDNARETLNKEIIKMVAAKEKKKQVLEKIIARHETNLKELNSEAMFLNKSSIEYMRLSNEIDNFRKIYLLVLKRIKETQITGIAEFSSVDIIEKATAPLIPMYPNKQKNMAITLVLGIFISIGLAFLKDTINNQIYNFDEIERISGKKILGNIPTLQVFENGSEAGKVSKADKKDIKKKQRSNIALYTHNFPQSEIAESVRFIRTNIMFSWPNKPHNTLIVTSSLAKEGKTTVINFLGVSLTNVGKKVLIIDCDLRKPMIHKLHDIIPDKGVTNYIIDDTTRIDELVYPTIVKNLDVICAGSLPPDPTEFLSSDRFELLITELQARYDYVLIDSPPILPVTDSMLITRVCHGVIFVMKPSICNRNSFKASVKQIKSSKTPILGITLNSISHRDVKSYHKYNYKYSYYSYKHGYSYKSDENNA